MVLPKFWTYLLGHFFSRFFGTLFLVLFLLITARFQEIASFLALSGSFKQTAIFVCIQLPLLLPFAMTIAATVSSYSLTWGLTSSNELVALRLSSLSLHSIFAPIRYSLLILAGISALISAEYAPLSRILSKKALEDATVTNPFSLLQQGIGSAGKNVAVSYDLGSSAEELQSFRGVFYNEKEDTLELALADTISMMNGEIRATNLRCLRKEQETYMLDQSKDTYISTSSISDWVSHNKDSFSSSSYPVSYHLLSGNQKKFMKSLSFLFFPLSLVALSFAGLAGGYGYSRSNSKKGRAVFFTATLLSFFGFTVGRSFAAFPALSLSLYIVPNLLALALGIYSLQSAERGGA